MQDMSAEVTSADINNLREKVARETSLEEENLALISKHDLRANKLRWLLIAIVLINIILFFTLQHYPLDWVVASFFMYMYYFIVLLFPTTRRVRSPAQKRKGIKAEPGVRRSIAIKELLKRGKRNVALAFWNSFFIGTQTLAKGIELILAISILFALLSGFALHVLDPSASLIIVLQALAIVGYYQIIIRYRPYSKDFLRTVASVRKGAGVRWQPYFKGAVIAITIIAVLAILLITAIFFPKKSLDAVISTFDSGLALDLVGVVLIFVSQFIIVRYIQGFDSARITTQFIKSKIDFLKQDILSKLDDLGSQTNIKEKTNEFQSLNERFSISRIYKIAYKDIFGILPTYPIIVDFKAVLEKDVASALGKDIPLDIPSGQAV